MTTTITLSMTASETGVPGLSTGSLTATRTNTNTDVQGGTQLIGNAADEALDIPTDIGTEGDIVIKNLDSTNYVELSYDTGASFATYKFAKIRAGGIISFTPAYPTGKTVIYAQADTADVTVHAFYVEE